MKRWRELISTPSNLGGVELGFRVLDDLVVALNGLERHHALALVLVEKGGDGRVTTKEILQVRFSQLEETEPGITSN